MKDSTARRYQKRLEDVERAIEKVDPSNSGFTSSALAEYLNSKYDGPPAKKGVANRKTNARNWTASGTLVTTILKQFSYPFVRRMSSKTFFHLGTDTEEIQKEYDRRAGRWKNKLKMENYIEPFIRYWTDDAYGLEDVATEMGVPISTISAKFRRLEESSTYDHYPVQYKERTGRKRKFTSRKKKKES